MAKTKAKAAAPELDVIAYTLEQLSDGSLLAEIAEELGIKRTTLYMRLQQTDALVDAYARAREDGLHTRGEKLRAMTQRSLPILPSGGIDSAAVSQLKIEVDAEKWLLSKLLPKIFGDKLDLKHSGGVSVVPVTPTDEAL